MLKRIFDLIFSALGLIIFLPVFLIIGILIWIVDGYPIIFKQKRVGKNGKFFNLLKFRTMQISPDCDRKLSSSNDHRITKLGNKLRYYKLDELPQLINVFCGDMSFVGYRPEIPYYVNKYTEEERRILNYKPGIVDPATLKYSRTENEILALSKNIEKDYLEIILPQKINLSLKYAQRATFFTDLCCIIKCLTHLI